MAKKAFFVIALFLIINNASAQITKADVAGRYSINKMYINDTLFFDAGNPEKSNKNILVEIGKANPIAFEEDSTIAIYLFYKDIYKALNTSITLNVDGGIKTSCRDRNDRHTYLVFPKQFNESAEKWEFDEGKQRIITTTAMKTKDKYPVFITDGKVHFTIEDKREKVKLEMKKM